MGPALIPMKFPASRFSRLSNDFLLPVLTTAVVISLILVAIGSFNTFKVSHGFRYGITQNFEVQRLSGEIIHLNEVMTMSARMAATTGDLSWEGRYDAYEPILSNTFERAKALAPDAHKPYATQINQADLRLKAMNRKAFDCVRKGSSAKAQEVVFSDAYKEQKELYTTGIRQWSESLNESNQLSLNRYGNGLFFSGAFSAVSFLILMLAWVTVLFMVKRYMRLRQDAELGLRRAKHQLEKSHQALQVSQAALLQKATTLEGLLEALQKTEGELEASHQALQVSKAALAQKASTLEDIVGELQQTQVQMVQSEKMSSLGQLVAGIAHEINNPVNFIYANLEPIREYMTDLLRLIKSYQFHCPEPPLALEAEVVAADLNFVQEDLPKILGSMEVGAERIRQIVLSLRNFSRSDERGLKPVDVHEGLESTLVILQHRLKERTDYSAIDVVRDYSSLPLVECYPGQLNQVFMNLLSNAIDALDEDCEIQAKGIRGEITIRTSVFTGQGGGEWVEVAIADTGVGIAEGIQSRIFDAFFTTKPVGKGTGIGLSISQTIVAQNHGGKLFCSSVLGEGAEFVVHLPVSVVSEPVQEANFVVQPPVSISLDMSQVAQV